MSFAIEDLLVHYRFRHSAHIEREMRLYGEVFTTLNEEEVSCNLCKFTLEYLRELKSDKDVITEEKGN
jgi:hypothetical protein